MRLYRIRPSAQSDPFKVLEESSRKLMAREVGNAMAKVLARVLSINSIDQLHFTIYKILADSRNGIVPTEPPARIEDWSALINSILFDEIYCKMRDSSCRFIDFGTDYTLYLC